MIEFLLNDELVRIEHERADLTVLNYLRDSRTMCGTKEGCASGDCGACTVVVAELNTERASSRRLNYYSLNSCVTFLSAIHGKQLITVEHIGNTSNMHPVQQAMVDNHGSQCGFCTPGFIMSMFALYHSDKTTNTEKEATSARHHVTTALSGNLCRCTGYQPIINAALEACSNTPNDAFTANEAFTITRLIDINKNTDIGTEQLILPTTRALLKQALNKYPRARLVAGSTDLALEHTQQLNALDTLISVSHIPALSRIEQRPDKLVFGAASPLNKIHDVLTQYFPMLDEIVERFASLPIRNQATLGGNIANASPIGDMPPVMLALNANVLVDSGDSVRRIPINEFFVDYRKTKLQKNEWIDAIEVPLPESKNQIRAYKISKRFEDDISAVCAAFNLALDEKNCIKALSTGFGGLAATPIQSSLLQDSLIGKHWASKETLTLGKSILQDAFAPIDDVRASAAYRRTVVVNLWHRFWLETNTSTQKIATRVIEHA